MTHPLEIKTNEATLQVSLQGGCITRYQLSDGFDLFRPAKVTSEILEVSSFPLVPYSNRIKNGKFRFQETDFQLLLNFGDHPHSIHGVGWTSNWEVVEHSEDLLEIALDYKKGDWPFKFRAVQKFQLSGSQLTQEFGVENTDEKAMPVGLGAHPYFPRHSGARLKADISHVWMNDPTCLPIERVSVPKRWDLSQTQNVEDLLCDHVFEGWDGLAEISWPVENRQLRIEATDELDRLVVYAPEGEDFFCVEPVSHMTDAFNKSAEGMPPEESGIHILEPGQRWSAKILFIPS